MSKSEQNKWLFVAVLAAVLVAVIWYQVNRADEPAAAAPASRRRAAGPHGRELLADVAPLVLQQPETVQALLVHNPFESPRLDEAEVDEESADEPAPVDPTQLVPEWLRQGRIEAVLQQGNRRIAIIAGRTIREGQRIGGVEVVRITEEEIILRPVPSVPSEESQQQP